MSWLWETIAAPFRSLWGPDEAPSPQTPTAPAPSTAPTQTPGPTGPVDPNTVADVMSHYADPPAPRPPADPHVVYLGINDASRESEKKAFAGRDDATVITGAGTNKAMDGKVLAKDGKTVLDLGNQEHLRTYMGELGLGDVRTGVDGKPTETREAAAARMGALEDLFLGKQGEDGQRAGGIAAGSRDEMGQFLGVLQRAEKGDINLDRVVMSGHSTGEWVYSEAEGSPGVTFEQMKALMTQFPQAAGGVKDFMLSACHTLEKGAGTAGGEQYKEIFPNLETTWGYDGYSPSWKQGSTQHVKNWLQASEGDDPAKVAKAAKRSGQNATVKQY